MKSLRSVAMGCVRCFGRVDVYRFVGNGLLHQVWNGFAITTDTLFPPVCKHRLYHFDTTSLQKAYYWQCASFVGIDPNYVVLQFLDLDDLRS